jgi:hypothetical protein
LDDITGAFTSEEGDSGDLVGDLVGGIFGSGDLGGIFDLAEDTPIFDNLQDTVETVGDFVDDPFGTVSGAVEDFGGDLLGDLVGGPADSILGDVGLPLIEDVAGDVGGVVDDIGDFFGF